MPSLKEIQSFTPPVLHSGKEWYIDFYAFDPVLGKMRRKKIKLNFIKKVNERRKYAKDYMIRLSEQLSLGWNPWIEQEHGNAYLLFKDVTDKYRSYIYKMLRDGQYRPETLKSYASYLYNIETFNNERKVPITYIYQFNKDFCVMLLEEVYILRDNSAFTRDNYLAFLRSFSTFCLERNYLSQNPTTGISSIGRKGKKKNRTQLKKEDLVKLTEYLQEKNPHFLLACYILYYCFIRPAEMSKLKLSNINLAKQTLFVPDTVSKNKKDGTITLPAKVIRLMVDLNIFKMPNEAFIFSDNFKPGMAQKSEKIFRDYWARHVRVDLKFPAQYKFYSLKDTGITNMLRHYDTLSVRDQARHSSILMTDIYTPHDVQEANDLIKNHEGAF